MSAEPRLERAVLLGAGWSIPFGGYTTRDLTDRVRGELWGYRELRNRLDVTTSQRGAVSAITYEALLGELQEYNEVDNEKILLAAIEKVMRRMDADMRAYRSLPWVQAGMSGYHTFLSGLARGGVVFTLNHDLWFERFVAHGAIERLNILGQSTPGANVHPSQSWDAANNWEPEDFVPSENNCSVDNEALNIVKLHGSLNWQDEFGRILVMGTNKESTIEAQPVLRCLSTLKDQLLVTSKKIMIYGYSFGDKHINETLINASKRGAQFYVFNVQDYPALIQVLSKAQPEELSHRLIARLKHYSSLGERVFRKPPLTPPQSAILNTGAIDDRLRDFLPDSFPVSSVSHS